MIIIKNKNITVSHGNTVNIAFTLNGINSNGTPVTFTSNDRVLLIIRDKDDNEMFKASYSITSNKFIFSMNGDQADIIPPGKYKWDFTIYFNAILDGNGYPVGGNPIITPFTQPADYVIQEVVSNE
jgi:hypothetical protein